MQFFKKKMTVDYLAGIVAEAIEENISVHKKAIVEHASENVTEDQIYSLLTELWVIELSIVDIVLSSLKRGYETTELGNLVPMIVVGYSPLDKENYLSRTEYYAKEIAKNSSDRLAISIGEAFVAASQIDYRNERSDVNPKALAWAIGMVSMGSLNGLGELISHILKDYKIV